jgi:hypothetical protein
MQNQCYSLFSIPAGCNPTQQDGASITDRKKNASSSLSTKSIYMQFNTLLIQKLFKILEINFRQDFGLQYTIFKATELQLLLTQYSSNKFRFQLPEIAGVLSPIPLKSNILKGFINFLKIFTSPCIEMQDLVLEHEFLLGFTARKKLVHARMYEPATIITSNI